jgi:hypothetical protein
MSSSTVIEVGALSRFAWSHSVEPLQSRIDSQARTFELDGDFIGRLSGVQHVTELVLFVRCPRPCWRP